MKPLPASSGDLLADRRADYANMLFASKDHAAAAEVLMGALEIAPDWAMGWFRLGEFHEAAGDKVQAAEAWRMSLKLEPADRPGATLKLELLGVEPATSAPPSAFVETLFDQYAPKFEKSLVELLDYRVPELLESEILAQKTSDFRHAIDLGCGTGLMGERLRPICERLDGYDISAEMLKKARAKNVYDSLTKADLQDLLLPPESADLIAAADVFMYLGALENIVATVTNGLSKGGLFAFSVELHDEPEGFTLRPSRRYAHSESYLKEVLACWNFEILSMRMEIIRRDRGEPLEGLIVVAKKP
ncbi:methyltransferase domain-containing protein [Mesorhizobium sp. SB112]|uniref:methyltransferase domain-containing protein n=1 Tax=Mesorhizobium sp. SB112 TaxID=3151853 RepID=UPI0032638F24